MAINRKRADLFFTCLFRVMSLTSVLALASILIFVFVQGAGPFVSATAPGIRIVPERIEEITVNGIGYRNHTTFINIPPDATAISLGFSNGETSGALEIAVHNSEKDPEKKT
jgi:hypothetical protein